MNPENSRLPVPSFDALMNPLLKALFALGGSGSVDEILQKVLEIEGIDEEVSSIPHNPDKSNQTEIGYRLAWARTYLKKYGFLENSARGVWALTKLARDGRGEVDAQDVVRKVKELDREAGGAGGSADGSGMKKIVESPHSATTITAGAATTTAALALNEDSREHSVIFIQGSHPFRVRGTSFVEAFPGPFPCTARRPGRGREHSVIFI